MAHVHASSYFYLCATWATDGLDPLALPSHNELVALPFHHFFPNREGGSGGCDTLDNISCG
jgi:hypothetical protein